ncbi:AbrB/MazE/SpoVT family DNA-binding domain-containing protein [Ectobacillus sp. sgz5001026]|uniref:AbrB/MazE/SpoVT family DNA-binding domain-containing protein n=1 Tax=Ectobacillus sp. sgz5001026 TaxID=3242473 RepID=UPI0036D34EF0
MSHIQKWGNSLGVRIPKALLAQVGMNEGAEVDFVAEGDTIIVKPKQKRLDSFLSKITNETLHHEIQTGEPQGRETW